MAIRKSLTASLLLAAFPYLNLALDPSAPTQCYVLDGTPKMNAGFRCNNATSGHSSCCAPGAICYSNGVCAQANGAASDWLRVGCTDQTWSDPACLEQCSIFANSSTAGIRFCDSSDITKTNKYCCDNGKFGVGSFKCCDDPVSIFVINPIATILAQMPLSQLTTSTSSSATTVPTPTIPTPTIPTPTIPTPTNNTAPAQTTSSPPPTSKSASKDNEGGSNGAAIGAGIGVPVGVIALGLIGFLAWRHRKKQVGKAAELEGGSANGSGIGMVAGRTGAYKDSTSPLEMESNAPAIEVDGGQGIGGNKAYFGRDYDESPQESTNRNDGRENGVVHEMDGVNFGR